MSETAVRVDLRQATLSESARLRETSEQAFLCLENPPPVRSLLRISVGETQRAFEVGRVIEVVDEIEAERGCYGAFVALERLSEQQRVGSEHLQPGNLGSGGSGVPSPVVIMNTNEMLLSLGEAGSDEDEARAAGMADDREMDDRQSDDRESDDHESDNSERNDSERNDGERNESPDSSANDSEQSDDSPYT
jgi:hypothetical protein